MKSTVKLVGKDKRAKRNPLAQLITEPRFRTRWHSPAKQTNVRWNGKQRKQILGDLDKDALPSIPTTDRRHIAGLLWPPRYAEMNQH